MFIGLAPDLEKSRTSFVLVSNRLHLLDRVQTNTMSYELKIQYSSVLTPDPYPPKRQQTFVLGAKNSVAILQITHVIDWYLSKLLYAKDVFGPYLSLIMRKTWV